MKTSLFGTDGIRARIGTHPLTHEFLPHLAHALGIWLTRQSSHLRLLLATDSRISGEWIKAHITTALLSQGIEVFDAHLLPTPAAAALVTIRRDYDFALIISASHNPFFDNGIKIIGPHGKISEDQEKEIESLLSSTFTYPSYDSLSTLTHVAAQAMADYATLITSYFPSHFLTGISVVLDCAQGASSFIAPFIFKQLGAEVITIHHEPNGKNINADCGALNPDKLIQTVIQKNAAFGFAFDGDGDRVIACTSAGTLLDGDDIIFLLSHHPLFTSQSHFALTCMSNLGLINSLKQRGKNVIITSVGDKYVLQALEHHNALLGGEQSGHIIMRDYAPVGDGIFTALRILEMLIGSNTLYSPTSFARSAQFLINLPVRKKIPLEEKTLQSILLSHTQKLPNGRVVVRYSGTESVLRVMVEDSDKEHAEQIIHSLMTQLKDHFNRSQENS